MVRVHFVPRRCVTLSAVLGVAAAVACSPDGADQAAAGDSAAATVAAAPADTGMAGMDHSNMPGMNRPAPRDSNQSFLRMMSDHHEGLIAIADSAGARAQDSTARRDSEQLETKQRREQQEMLAMLRGQYQDSITPMVIPSNRTMLDSTLSATGPALGPTFYRQVVHHHREGIAMTEPMMPHLTGDVRQMADRMVAEQRREIEEFERKAQASQTR